MSQASIGQHLVQAGYITACQFQSALAFQRSWNGRLGLEDALAKLGLISSSQRLQLARRTDFDRLIDPANEPMDSAGACCRPGVAVAGASTTRDDPLSASNS